MSIQAGLLNGASQTILQSTKSTERAGGDLQIDLGFIGSMSEVAKANLQVFSVSGRNQTQNAALNEKEQNPDEWGWPEDEEVAAQFMKRIEKIINQLRSK
jgi:hypothetical protein